MISQEAEMAFPALFVSASPRALAGGESDAIFGSHHEARDVIVGHAVVRAGSVDRASVASYWPNQDRPVLTFDEASKRFVCETRTLRAPDLRAHAWAGGPVFPPSLTRRRSWD